VKTASGWFQQFTPNMHARIRLFTVQRAACRGQHQYEYQSCGDSLYSTSNWVSSESLPSCGRTRYFGVDARVLEIKLDVCDRRNNLIMLVHDSLWFGGYDENSQGLESSINGGCDCLEPFESLRPKQILTTWGIRYWQRRPMPQVAAFYKS